MTPILAPLLRTGAQALIAWLLVLLANHGFSLQLSPTVEGALVVLLAAGAAAGLHLLEKRYPKLAARLLAPVYTVQQFLDRAEAATGKPFGLLELDVAEHDSPGPTAPGYAEDLPDED